MLQPDRDKKNQEYTDNFRLLQEARATQMKAGEGAKRLAPEFNAGRYGDRINTTKFDTDFVPGRDFWENEDPLESQELLDSAIDETRAQRQGNWGRVSSGLGRLIPKIGAELGKSVGYVGGAIPALIAWDLDYMSDNFVVQAFENLEESAKEAMPVYVRRDIENGNFWRKTMSSEFFANEGIDGVGFLIAAIGTGYGLGAISKGMGVGTKLAQGIGKGKNAAGIIDNGMIGLGQTIYEAGSEMRGTELNLKAIYDGYEKNEDGLTITPEGDLLTPEQVKDRINLGGRITFWLNMPMLLISNHIQTDMLFGKGTSLGKSAFKRLDDVSSPEAIAKSMLELGARKETMIVAGENALKGIVNESFEEWSQFAFEDYATRKGKGEEINIFKGLLEGMIEAATTIEGQQSIFLGGVLGMGPGVIGGIRETKQLRTQREGLSKILSENKAAFNETLNSFFKKDKDGNPELKDGKIQIDIPKLIESLDSTGTDIKLSQQLAAGMLRGDNRQIKAALQQVVFRKISPYLRQEGGIVLWDQHIDTMVEEMSPEGVTALGFKSKEDYKSYLKELGEISSKAYDVISDRGPSFYGIKINDLLAKGMSVKEGNELVSNFIEQIENTAVFMNIVKDGLLKDLNEVNKEINSITVDPGQKGIGQTITDISEIENIKALNKKKESLEKALKNISEGYNSLFDKKAQQKAFDDSLAEANKFEKLIKEDEAKNEEDNEFIEEWYQMLADKGYNVSSSLKDKTNDFGSNTVTLKDDNGEVYRIEKRFDKKKGHPYFILKNLDTNKEVPLTIENLKKLGLDKESNILTKEEFQKWLKMNRIANANNIRLSHLKQLIAEHTANRHSYREEVKILKDKLEKYNEELQFWLSVDDVSYTEVLDELIRLEENIAEVNREIEFNENNEKGLSITIKSLQQFKSELEAIIEDGNKQELVFTNKLKELEKQLLDGDFDLDLNTIIESIDITKSILDDLYNVKDKLQDTFDDLINVLSNMNDIELMFDEGVSNKLIELLQEYAPDIEINGNKLVNLTKRQLRHLLHNKNTANTILSELKDNKRELMNAYAVTSQDLADIKSQIKSLRTTLNKLGENKNLLIKYETLDSNIKTLAIRNRIKKDIKIERGLSFNQNNKGKNKVEQNDKDSESQNEEALVRKYNPWTTITSLYKTENGKVVWKNGEKVLHENAKQSIKWSKAVSQIPIDKLSNYSVRFVNAEQLGELLKDSSEEVPVVSDSALYAVIYDNSTQMPINVGGLIYTGIAEPSTYFREDGRVTIDVTRMPAYMSLFSRDINENNPVTFKNESYNNRESLLKAVENFIKEDYIAWRQEVLDNIKDGNLAISAITDISKGIGRYSKTKFNKPKDVLNIKSLRVARGSNMSKSNGREGLIEVENGMVYAELDNGQMQRLLNIKIGNLPEAQKNAYLNKIVRFMSLAQYLNNKDFKSKFKFAGKSKDSISLFGSENKPGILDLFINWGRKKIGEVEGRSIYKDWGIAIYAKDPGNINSPLEIRFDMKDSKGSTVSIKMDFSDIIDAKGNARDIRHPKLRLLADFLESKFMNVNYSKVGSDKGFKMPKNWTKKGNVIEITYDAYPTYNDYVLDNSLITNIEPKIEGSDKLPQFVNQYATFDRDIKSSFPKSTKEEPTKKGGLGSSLSKKDDAPKKGGLAGSLKNNTSSGGSLAASLRGAQSQPDSEFSKGLLDAYEKEFLEGYQSDKKNDELANYEKMFDNFKENKDFVEPVLQEKDSKKDCGPGKGGIKKPKSNKNRGGLAL